MQKHRHRRTRRIMIIDRKDADKLNLFKNKMIEQTKIATDFKEEKSIKKISKKYKILELDKIETVAHIGFDKYGNIFVPKKSVPEKNYEEQQIFLRIVSEYLDLLEGVKRGEFALNINTPFMQKYSDNG